MKLIEHQTTDDHFIVTKEYRRFQEFCDACRRDRYIGLCYGPAGVGKTLSARHYTQWDALENMNSVHSSERILKTPPFFRTARTVFFTAEVVNSPRKTMDAIQYYIKRLQELVYNAEMAELIGKEEISPPYPDNWKKVLAHNSYEHIELLIIDEADRLKAPTIEEIRDFYDRNHFGIVFIGMLGIEKRLSRYPQLYSRIGFAHEFKHLSSKELFFIMEHYFRELNIGLNPDDFTDHETITTIVSVTRGNFRLFRRLFTQIKRIMQINNTSTVTKEIVQAARECLVIGL